MVAKRIFALFFALLVALSIGSVKLAAQTSTTGDVTGVVTDPSGAVVPEAKVSLIDNSKGTTAAAKSGKDGVYHFYLLSPGSYTLAVTAPGFETESREVNVALGQIATIDFHLTLGASTQTIMVTEAAPLVQTENGDSATAVNAQQVSNVPNPGNDLSAIAQLAPGVISNTNGGYGNVEAFGMPATSNLFTLNGMDDNDPFLNLNNSGASNLLLGSNEVQEADVVTNGYSSTYGTFAGINVNYITKSGGNQFHGNAVYYWNGRAMNANGWFHNQNGEPRPFENANQWAGSVGGPIKKDKMFFFFNTEGIRVLIPVPQNVIVPTASFEAATVANLTNLGLSASIPYYCQNIAGVCPGVSGVPGSGGGMFNYYNTAKNQAFAQQITSDGGCGTLAGITGFGQTTPFGPGNPCAVSILETPINKAPENQAAGRFDWNIGNNDRAYLRMQYDRGVQPTVTDPINPIFNDQSDQPEYQGQLNETHTFGPTLSNQFLLAATWYSAIFAPANLQSTLAAFPATLQTDFGPFTNLGGAVGFAFPQGRKVTQFQVGDDVSKNIGNHTVKFGAKFHKNYVSDHDNAILADIPLELPIGVGDLYNGGDSAAPGSIGSLLLRNFAQSTDIPVRLYEVSGYVQDEWRIKSNFTITPALRLEHASNPTCVTLCFAQFSEPFSTIAAEPTAPYNQEINPNRRQALLGYQNLQWEPRISFAWQPFGGSATGWKSDWVVRGGIGIFYDIFPGGVSDNMQNPPLLNQFTIASTSLGGNCSGFLSPNQPGGNLYSCAATANSDFNSAFVNGSNSVTFLPNLAYTEPETKAPQFQKWSLEVQKGLGRNDSIDIGYYGNHGLHIPVFNNSVNAFGLFPGLPAAAPTSQYGVVTNIVSAGISNYNGLIVSYKHRVSGWAGSGVFQFNYTYSHAFDDVSNGGFFAFNPQSSTLNPENPYDIKANYGPADYDVRHSLNANYVWELPIRKAFGGHGIAALVDGWQVSGAVFYRTPLPFSVTDTSFEGVNNYNAALFPNPAPGTSIPTCNSEKYAGSPALSSGTQCFSLAQFPGAPSGETTFGAPGLRNLFRGPTYFDTDFSFTKRTKVPKWEHAEFALGLQFFNLFNHPNFQNPYSDVTSGFFGTIQNTVNPPTSILGSFLGGDASPRLIQVKAQFTF